MNGAGSWRIAPAPFVQIRRLADELGVSDVLAQVLVRRGYDDPAAARAFLHPDIRVHDPYLMTGMAAARSRIDQALKRGEPIAVHGDYDADGITATHLLVGVLGDLGADVRWRLPNRFGDGYGVSLTAVDELAAAGVKLMITVDCGITAREPVERARELGMDVIVTDHHELEGDPPDCIIVTPRLGTYPCRDLAGVGVALKLAHALLEEPGESPCELPLALRPYSDLVAVGTIADVVPLLDENRVLAMIGLGRLRSAPRPGLAALLEVSGGRPGSVDARVVGFRLGPRLNAAGRLEDAALAFELLGSADREAALPLALRLNELNHERQAIEAGILREAVAMVPDPPPPALVLSSPSWHEGVVGIVASRVAERFNRPAILLSEGDDDAKGSGRSIPAFDLLGAVERTSELLLSFGGHRAACGLRLRRADLPAFREAFVAEAAATLTEADLRRERRVDAVVSGDELTLALADELELLEPHGFGNRQVTLLLHGARVVAPRLTRDKRHAQYGVRCDGASCRAIHFNFDDLAELSEPGRHDVALALTKNEYNGTVSAQVRVRGLHRLPEPQSDLCATACELACRERLSGEQLWRALLAGGESGAVAPPDPEAAAAALRAARAAGRIIDRRGRPPISQLAALLAGGESVLVLVADVARRRPLLTHDLLTPGLERPAAYVQAACRPRLAAVGASLVLTTPDLVLDDPASARRFAHVVVLDPPLTTTVWAELAATAPEATLHALWGRDSAAFAAHVRAGELDLDAVMRRVWRALARHADAGRAAAAHAGREASANEAAHTGSEASAIGVTAAVAAAPSGAASISTTAGRFDASLERSLLGGEGPLASLAALTAAFAVLREADLLVVTSDGGYHLKRTRSKVDVTRTRAWRRWHSRYQTPDFLPTCLTARL